MTSRSLRARSHAARAAPRAALLQLLVQQRKDAPAGDARLGRALRVLDLHLGHPGAGEGFELLAITACILGGLSLMGGQGSVIGILVGSLLIGVLQNEMVMLNINPFWHKIVIGLVLLAAITFDYARRRKR